MEENKMLSIKSQVVKYLEYNNNGKTPTEIGLAIGKNYNSASSSVTNPLKNLMKEGIVERTKIDGRVLYSLIRPKKRKMTLEIRISTDGTHKPRFSEEEVMNELMNENVIIQKSGGKGVPLLVRKTDGKVIGEILT